MQVVNCAYCSYCIAYCLTILLIVILQRYHCILLHNGEAVFEEVLT